MLIQVVFNLYGRQNRSLDTFQVELQNTHVYVFWLSWIAQEILGGPELIILRGRKK